MPPGRWWPSHRDAGDRLVLTTATNRFLTEPIATDLASARDALIATELAEADGVFTGSNAGILNMREGKVARLAAWLRGPPASDLCPLRERPSTATRRTTCRCYARSAVPVAVNPDPAPAKRGRRVGAGPA